MATLNIGMKINGGGTHNRTTVGSGTVFTTGPNEYAKVYFQLNSVSGASATIAAGSLSYTASGGSQLSGEFEVPPNTSLTTNLSFAGGQYARCNFVRLSNTQ